MGIIWRAMPMLSTLAALVIIVHSAEEDLDTNRRYELRPRSLDTEASNYEEPWRAIEAESTMQQSPPPDWYSPEPGKRRRPLRKRKRRPHHSTEDMTRQDTIQPHQDTIPTHDTGLSFDGTFDTAYPDEYHHHRQYSNEATEVPRRRRKKQSRHNRWTDEYIDDRPRRRRKRPIVESRLQIDDTPEIVVGSKEYTATEKTGEDESEDPMAGYHVEEQDMQMQSTERITLPKNEYERKHLRDKTGNERIQSSSEVSFDDDQIITIGDADTLEKSKWDSSPDSINSIKDLLKKSNGASLSEILQQHNLSLADFLRDKGKAISLLNASDLKNKKEIDEKAETETIEQQTVNNETHEVLQSNKETTTTEATINIKTSVTEPINQNIEAEKSESDSQLKDQTNKEQMEVETDPPKIVSKRRYQGNIRRKLRMRPPVNNNVTKTMVNRDFKALTARRYFNNSRISTKGKEWKPVLATMIKNNETNKESATENTIFPITTTHIPENETTVSYTEYYNPTTIVYEKEPTNDKGDDENIVNIETTQVTTTIEASSTDILATTEKPKTTAEPKFIRPGLRRQAYNRLRRKLKRKLTTESPSENDFVIDLFGLPSLVSSSEFIARTQTPSIQDDEEAFPTIEDFITTDAPRRTNNHRMRGSTSVTPRPYMILSTTEETAKFEIEEIFNDTRTSARLSKILMERNMSLNELVEHRERGSSHVHLADIFHNASREPNPPEPFLTKSVIEPISRETYPLIALLDANLHDPLAKASTIDPNENLSRYLNIPVSMNFGNNVNENGENMGIMALFNKLAGSSEEKGNEEKLQKVSESTTYVTITEMETSSPKTRESRILKDDIESTESNFLGWKELITLIKNDQNETDIIINSLSEGLPQTPQHIAEDRDDGLIVLEDLQNLKDNDSHKETDAKLELITYDVNPTSEPGVLDRLPSNTRSVTVATASIVGLSMILFLLTYAAFKWKQQRQMFRSKENFETERIPTPVFENRKGHKNNCSTRSISPMLSSNIYSMNTLDSRTGKESPEYMWDSLRKPFQ